MTPSSNIHCFVHTEYTDINMIAQRTSDKIANVCDRYDHNTITLTSNAKGSIGTRSIVLWLNSDLVHIIFISVSDVTSFAQSSRVM